MSRVFSFGDQAVRRSVLALDDAEPEHIMTAARPLPPKLRGKFLRAVATELEQRHQRGPGVIYRAYRGLQRKYFDPRT